MSKIIEANLLTFLSPFFYREKEVIHFLIISWK